MSGSIPQQEELALIACSISRDVQVFDLLIEDMETAVGEAWGDLSLADANAFFSQPEADDLVFVTIAIDREDEPMIGLLEDIVTTAKSKDIKVILVAEDASPASLHRLLRAGADEFIPYPLPDGELEKAIERVTAPAPEIVADNQNSRVRSKGDRQGIILPIHGLAGGTGATTLAVNLAWELTQVDKGTAPRVCILDLDLQFGAVSTYLDLPRREAVYEMLSDTESMDNESFCQALVTYNEDLHVLTAPPDILPLDFIGPDDVQRILDVARQEFDFVIVDMPTTLVQWTETVLTASQVYLATLEIDMRSVQNTLRIKRALQAEDLPFEKLRFALNRAPKFTDISGRGRVKRIAETLGIKIELQLPDGGKQVMQGADHGQPLQEAAPKSALRKEITNLAESLRAFGTDDVAEVG